MIFSVQYIRPQRPRGQKKTYAEQATREKLLETLTQSASLHEFSSATSPGKRRNTSDEDPKFGNRGSNSNDLGKAVVGERGRGLLCMIRLAVSSLMGPKINSFTSALWATPWGETQVRDHPGSPRLTSAVPDGGERRRPMLTRPEFCPPPQSKPPVSFDLR
jgi:hypothetical protein